MNTEQISADYQLAYATHKNSIAKEKKSMLCWKLFRAKQKIGHVPTRSWNDLHQLKTLSEDYDNACKKVVKTELDVLFFTIAKAYGVKIGTLASIQSAFDEIRKYCCKFNFCSDVKEHIARLEGQLKEQIGTDLETKHDDVEDDSAKKAAIQANFVFAQKLQAKEAAIQANFVFAQKLQAEEDALQAGDDLAQHL